MIWDSIIDEYYLNMFCEQTKYVFLEMMGKKVNLKMRTSGNESITKLQSIEKNAIRLKQNLSSVSIV